MAPGTLNPPATIIAAAVLVVPRGVLPLYRGAAMTGEEFFSGVHGVPIKIFLASGHDKNFTPQDFMCQRFSAMTLELFARLLAARYAVST